jgi:hypothetical protein
MAKEGGEEKHLYISAYLPVSVSLPYHFEPLVPFFEQKGRKITKEGKEWPISPK